MNKLAAKRKGEQENSEPVEKRKKSEDSDTNSEPQCELMPQNCPICFITIAKKLIGLPNRCKHCFCLRCLKRWSKHKNTCPVCRTEYGAIIVRSRHSRSVLKQITVKKLEQENSDGQGSTHSTIYYMMSRVFVNLIGNRD